MKTKFFSTDVACSVYLQGRTRRFAPTAYCHCLLLLVLLTATFCAAAQNGVTVSNLEMDAGTVTFKVSWGRNSPVMPEMWSDSVWVFVDYDNNGTMERLPLLPGATLTAHTAPDDVGKVIEVPGNADGVWVVGNARSAGSFSATVQLLTGTGGFETRPYGGACAYASNYPPVGEYTSHTQLVFTGTPPYALVLKQVGGATTHTGASLDGTFLVPEGFTVESFTDKTGAPGICTCAPSLKPTIDTHPTASTSICSGGTVSLSVTARNANLYQWKKDGVDVSDGSGSTTANYTTAPLSGNATYTVVVSNGVSACSTTSSNALVTMAAYGISGSAPGPCGCALELTDCSGTCTASSSCWTACVTQISNVTNDGKLSWSGASTTCSNKGMRLPTLAELQCLCANKSTLPGGYESEYGYWTQSSVEGNYYYGLTMPSCLLRKYYVSDTWFVRCVK